MRRPGSRRVWIAALLAAPIVTVLVIASFDRLFIRAVPLSQRLLSRNDNIRKKAQQELLGLSEERKQHIVEHLAPVLERPDPFARKWAAISLALIGPAAQGAIPQLLNRVSDHETDVAQAARVALTEIGAPDPGQLPRLLQSLEDPNESVSCEAAGSIAKLGPAAEPALPRLSAFVSEERPLSNCLADALAALGDFHPAIEPELGVLLSTPSATVRTNAAMALARMPVKSSATLQAMLLRLADDDASSVRRVLAPALALDVAPERGRSRTLSAALRLSREPEVRRLAWNLLAAETVDEPVRIAAVWRGLRDSDPALRGAVLTWIAGREAAARVYQDALLYAGAQDPLPEHRRLAVAVLYRSFYRKTSGLQAVARLQRDSDEQVRCLAVQLLLEMNAPDRVNVSRLIDDLAAAPQDPACAVQVLAQAGVYNAAVLPALQRVAGGQAPMLARSRAAAALGLMGARAKPALPALSQASRDHVPGGENALRSVRLAVARERQRRR